MDDVSPRRQTRGPAGIGPWRDGFAVVDRAANDVALRLRLDTATGELVDEGAIRTAATRPEARPAVITSPDGVSVAVATFDRLSDDVLRTDSTRVVLTRAECAL